MGTKTWIVLGVLSGAVLACAVALEADVLRVAAGLAVGGAIGFGLNRLVNTRARKPPVDPS